MIPFGKKSVTLSMLIDLVASAMSCRSTQVKIASTDLSPQGMFTFSEMLALVESESSIGANVCHRGPGGSKATSDLVGHYVGDEQMSACGQLCASWRRFLYIGLPVKPRLHA